MFQEYPDVLAVEEVCEMLRVGHNTVYALLSSGRLKGMRFGRVWKIPKQAVLEFVARNSVLYGHQAKQMTII